MAIGKASTCHPERRKDKKEGGGEAAVPDVDSKKEWNKNK